MTKFVLLPVKITLYNDHCQRFLYCVVLCCIVLIVILQHLPKKQSFSAWLFWKRRLIMVLTHSNWNKSKIYDGRTLSLAPFSWIYRTYRICLINSTWRMNNIIALDDSRTTLNCERSAKWRADGHRQSQVWRDVLKGAYAHAHAHRQ